MARIPQAELERLKRDVDLVELVKAHGVKLTGRGDTFMGLCPFHDDKEPSLVISRAKNLWSCKGACNKGGSVIDWVMQCEALSFREAVDLLRKLQGWSEDDSQQYRLSFGASDEVVLREVVDFYHQALVNSPVGKAFLERRGILNEEAITKHKLGFVDMSLQLPRRREVEGRLIRDQLYRIGIVKDNGRPRYRGFLVIPVFDRHGQVKEIYGRRIDKPQRTDKINHLYLPGPRDRGVWNLEALSASKEIILCESLIDALTFWCAGFHNVTACYGTNGFTKHHIEAFSACGIERVLLAFDRDQAGDNAAKIVAEQLAANKITSYRVLFPRNMDANEYALKVTPSSQSLAVLLRAAEHIGGPVVNRSNQNRPVDVGDREPMNSSVSAPVEPAPPAAASPSPESPTETQAIIASPSPPPPHNNLQAEIKDKEVVISLEDRRYRIRGLDRNMSMEQMRINLLVSKDDVFHVDTFDLYSARQRNAFIKQAATELAIKPDTIKRDLGKALLKLEVLQEERITETLKEKQKQPSIGPEDRKQALALLTDPQLMDKISAAFSACGLVGERTNCLVAYLAAISRKLERPLAVIVQSSSAAGKSALMNRTLSFVPDEERVQYSAMTGQSLFYMAETSLQNKVLAIAEEEGAEKASYALKLLQSEGELSIASTGKDPATGRLVTQEYHVEGPVAILTTTTAIDLDEELLNRCIVLSVDESREQTRAIHQMQRQGQTLQGWRQRRKKDAVVKLHQNAQRLLRPLAVVNPFAQKLSFPDSCTRNRRDNEKYLSLITVITLLHQHQREIKYDKLDGQSPQAFIEATEQDIEHANRIASEVLGRTLDELPPQTRRLLMLIDKMVIEQCQTFEIERSEFRFTRRQIREHIGWGNTQLKVHLHRLEDMEYVLIHHGGPGQRFVYELLYDGQGKNGSAFVLGLINPILNPIRSKNGIIDANWSGSEDNRSGQNVNWSARGRAEVGGMPGGGRGRSSSTGSEVYPAFSAITPKNAHLEHQKEHGSFVQPDHKDIALDIV